MNIKTLIDENNIEEITETNTVTKYKTPSGAVYITKQGAINHIKKQNDTIIANNTIKKSCSLLEIEGKFYYVLDQNHYETLLRGLSIHTIERKPFIINYPCWVFIYNKPDSEDCDYYYIFTSDEIKREIEDIWEFIDSPE